MGKNVHLSEEILGELDKIKTKFACSYSEAIKKLLIASGYLWDEERLLESEIRRLFRTLSQYMPGDHEVLNSLCDMLVTYAYTPASERSVAAKIILEFVTKIKSKLEELNSGKTKNAQ